MKDSEQSIAFNRYNNIEWLRLLFAVQVMLVHIYHHINETSLPFVKHFPGVPAFFFTSGFLIYASYKKSTSVRAYFANRFLRLFPALFFVCFAAFILVVAVKGPGHLAANFKHYLIWFLGQITLAQAYNPAMFRDIGVGVMNGSLWTITVEILFYFSIPVIVFLENFVKPLLAVLLVCSFALYALGPDYLTAELAFGKTIFEFLELTPLVWGWMFLCGSLCYKYFDVINPFISKFWVAIIPLTLIILFGDKSFFMRSQGNDLGLIYFFFYILLILYIAFSVKYIPLGFDLSYGIYIWHMVIVNALLVYSYSSIFMALVLTLGASLVSWFVIERPSLKLKNYSIARQEARSPLF